MLPNNIYTNACILYRVEAFDPAAQCYYYYDLISQRSSWEKPAVFTLACDDDFMRSIIKIQTRYRMRIARKKFKETFLKGKQDVIRRNIPASSVGNEAELIRKKVAEVFRKQEDALAHTGDRFIECFDPTSGLYYYYNSINGETSWDRPSVVVLAADDFTMASIIRIQTMYRKRLAQKKFRDLFNKGKVKKKTKKTDEELLNEAQVQIKVAAAKRDIAERLAGTTDRFVECYDPQADAFYYYNSSTQESTWEKPSTYIAACDDDMMSAVIRIQSVYRIRLAKKKFKEKFREGKMKFQSQDREKILIQEKLSAAKREIDLALANTTERW